MLFNRYTNKKHKQLDIEYNTVSRKFFDLCIKHFRKNFSYEVNEAYKAFIYSENALTALNAMGYKYSKMFANSTKIEEKQKIINSIKILTDFLEIHYMSVINPRRATEDYIEAKNVLINKAKTLLEKEIFDFKHADDLRLAEEKRQAQEIELKKAKLLNDIKSL